MTVGDGLWHKDAIFYELHVRAFKDGNDDGIGDFIGLTSQLDYLKELGVDCLWLLPFFKSPLRDDGYDVSDYRAIHPDYGTMADFERFLEAAHARGLRVIADLVMNHTSDQHAWFQAARRSPESPFRDYYVWSDTDQGYRDARIIFVDTESSELVLGPGRQGLLLAPLLPPPARSELRQSRRPGGDARHHDLLARQGPRRLPVRRRALPLRAGGTSCENLPETHAYLKEVRAWVDAHYEGRILLAEANQWPADVRAYFGDGDEFHMAFHFPLMPRVFLAVRHADRRPGHRHLPAHPGDPAGLPVVPLPPQPRRAHARDGERGGAPASLLRLRRGPADAAERRDPAAPRPAARQ